MRGRTIRHGWKHLPHAEKMRRKREFAAQLEQRFADPGITARLKLFTDYWVALRRRHGVGRPPHLKKPFTMETI